MNNKFKSINPTSAEFWQNKMFKQGARWYDGGWYGGKELKYTHYKYYFCKDGIITCSDDDNEWLDSEIPEHQPILIADLFFTQIGDPVKCLIYGEGVVEAINETDYPFIVAFKDIKKSYTICGRLSSSSNPTLFYHFEGQFPTAEACVRFEHINAEEK